MKYIVCAIVEAEPEFKHNGHHEEFGYEVGWDYNGIVPQGWYPKSNFEQHTIPLPGDGTSITEGMVEDFVKDTDVSRMANHTVVLARLRNEFTSIADSACVDAKNYDENIGAGKCITKIYSRVWEWLGFLLATARADLRKPKD